MSTIDKFLNLLQDGLWHDLEATIQKVELSSAKAEMVISFLTEYEFIKLSENAKQIKLKHLALDFFTQIHQIE